ncbi:uncharacterized protein [Aegilops tauschii subsp. strangulata]|uniref:uncharacterized protein n=1 Tax=Aegilops tauschii subsp. strangulata TaxID=200361 RepID=UPI003CC8A247
MLLKLLHKFYNKFDAPWVHLVWDTYYASTRGITKVKIGAGDTALFWKDDWNNSILSETYPRAFSFTRDEDASTRKCLSITQLNQAFDLPLSVQAFDELRALQQNVITATMTDSKDAWICTWGSADFKTTAYYTFYFREMIAHDAYRWLWKTKCIPKIKVFGWFLLSDRLNTRNMLKRRHYNISNNLDCLLCGQHVEETVEHLFFHCTFSTACWNKLNVLCPSQGNRLELMTHLKTLNPRKMIMEVFLVAAWSLWKERNNNYFRKVDPSIPSWEARFRRDFADIAYRMPPTRSN